MIYLYGLIDPSADISAVNVAELSGVTGSVSVTPLPLGILVHGPAPEGEILPKRRFLLAHTRVLEAFDSAGPLLPMRFGMSAPSVSAVSAMLDREGQTLQDSFARLNGAVELGLRVNFPREAALSGVLDDAPELRAERDRLAKRTPPPHFEAAEFGRRLAEALDRRRGATQRALLDALRPMWRDHVLRTPDTDVQVLAVDVLVDRDKQDTLADALLAAAETCGFAPGEPPDIRIVGPVPAYSFVRLTLAANASEAA